MYSLAVFSLVCGMSHAMRSTSRLSRLINVEGAHITFIDENGAMRRAEMSCISKIEGTFRLNSSIYVEDESTISFIDKNGIGWGAIISNPLPVCPCCKLYEFHEHKVTRRTRRSWGYKCPYRKRKGCGEGATVYRCSCGYIFCSDCSLKDDIIRCNCNKPIRAAYIGASIETLEFYTEYMSEGCNRCPKMKIKDQIQMRQAAEALRRQARRQYYQWRGQWYKRYQPVRPNQRRYEGCWSWSCCGDWTIWICILVAFFIAITRLFYSYR